MGADDVGVHGVIGVLLGEVDVLLGGGVDDDAAAADRVVQAVAAQVAEDQAEAREAHL